MKQSLTSMSFLLLEISIFLIPCTYAVKFILGYPQITWINPTLLLSLISFLLLCLRGRLPVAKNSVTLWGSLFLIGVWLSSLGSIFSSNVPAIDTVLREPIRLTLNFLFFFLIAHFANSEVFRGKILRVLMWSVFFEFLIVLYFFLSMWIQLPLLPSAQDYIRDYSARQSWYVCGICLPRFGGTFIESPPLGLFALGAFLCFYHFHDNSKKLFKRINLFNATLIMLGALSSQIFLGFLTWLIGNIVTQVKRRMKYSTFIMVVSSGFVLLILFSFFTWQLSVKKQVERRMENRGSISERAWHIKFGNKLLTDNLSIALFGTGLGQYGEYAARTNLFPDTVTPQVLPTDLLTGTGVIGFSLWLTWIFHLLKRGYACHGPMAIFIGIAMLFADMFQANWNWEILYLVFGLLVTPNAVCSTDSDKDLDLCAR